jgi:hypothetical protein
MSLLHPSYASIDALVAAAPYTYEAVGELVSMKEPRFRVEITDHM